MTGNLQVFFNDYEEAKAEAERAMDQARALQELVRTQSSSGSGPAADNVEMKVLQRNLEGTQAELAKMEERLGDVLKEKTKLEQNLFRSHQELQDVQKSIDARVESQASSLKLELSTVKSDLTLCQQEVSHIYILLLLEREIRRWIIWNESTIEECRINRE